MDFFPHLWAGHNKHSRHFQVRDSQGISVEFSIENHRGILKTPSYGCTNLQGEDPSALYDIRNIQLVMENNIAKVTFPNAVQRFYLRQSGNRYQLEREDLPNGKTIFYEYDDRQKLKKMYLADPTGKYIYGSICKTGKDCYVGSDGREVCCHFKTTFIKGQYKKKHYKEKRTYSFSLMNKVDNPLYSNTMDYNDKTLLTFYDAKAYPVFFEYYQNQEELAKVKSLSTPSNTIFFLYDSPIAGKKGGFTKVIYPNKSVKIYRFDQNLLLTAIENYFEDELYNQKLFVYDHKQHIAKITTCDQNKVPLLTKYFTCDANGNPVQETWEGDFGSFTIKRVFSKNRLIREERENALSFEYTYLKDTHLVTSKTTLSFGKAIRKTVYIYMKEKKSFLLRK